MMSEPHIQTPNTTPTPTGCCITPDCGWKGNKKCRSKKCQRCCTDTECREHTKQAKRTTTIQRNRQQMMVRNSQLLREVTPVIVSQHIPVVRPEQFAQVVNEVRRMRTQLQILSQTPQPPNTTTTTSIISQTEMRLLPPEQRDVIIEAHETMTQTRDIAYSSFLNAQAEKQGVQFSTPKEIPQQQQHATTTTEVTKEPMLKCYLCLEEVAIKECVAPQLCGHLLCRGCSKELMTPFEHKDWMGMLVQSVGFKCPICSKISTSMTPLFTN